MSENNTMAPQIDPSETPSHLLHETVNLLSTIISIAHVNLLDADMSPQLQSELKRIIQAAHDASDNIKSLAEILQENE